MESIAQSPPNALSPVHQQLDVAQQLDQVRVAAEDYIFEALRDDDAEDQRRETWERLQGETVWG